MDIEKQRHLEDLRIQLQKLEAQETQLTAELKRIEIDKAAILKQMSEHTDERYEEDILAMVYEQRRKR